MIINEFLSKFKEVAYEVSTNGETIASHDIPALVIVECHNNDIDFEIIDIDVDYMGGCGCPRSVIIQLVDKDKEFLWSTAPKWANYLITDCDGKRYWSENKPVYKDKKYHLPSEGFLEVIIGHDLTFEQKPNGY